MKYMLDRGKEKKKNDTYRRYEIIKQKLQSL